MSLIGAGIGGLANVFGQAGQQRRADRQGESRTWGERAKSRRERRRDRRAGMNDRAYGDPGDAPQVAGAEEAYAQDRAQQQALLDQYLRLSQGNGTSQAQMMQAQANRQVTMGQMGMAAQAQGGTLGQQQRQVAGMGAASAMGTAEQVAMIRAQEMEQYRMMAAQQAAQMAGQSGALVGQNAGMGMQWGLGQRGLDQQALANKQAYQSQIMGHIGAQGEAAAAIAMKAGGGGGG